MKLTKEDIQDIENLFSITYMGDSRISNSPLFWIIKYDKKKIKIIEKMFIIEFIPLLEDNNIEIINKGKNYVSACAGYKDKVVFKIEAVKKDFGQFIRQKKLQKLNNII